jgi:PAS domain S-box-containing protein
MQDATWISTIDCEAIKTFFSNCHVPIIVSGTDGTIHWANDEFCEWSGYSVHELRQLGWLKLSAEGDSLQSDIAMARGLDGYRLTYTVQKQYVPKNDKPQWGALSVMRYPPTGEIEFCFCTWHPHKNGTQGAFEMAMKELNKMSVQIEGNRIEIAKLNTTTPEDVFMSTGLKLVKANPRISWTIFIIVLGIFGFNNILQIVTGLNLLPRQVQVTNPSK